MIKNIVILVPQLKKSLIACYTGRPEQNDA